MNLPQIIAITGRKYNGKDTTGDYLKAKYGYVTIAYATPLKEACRILFDFSEEQLYGKLKETMDETWGITPRKVFQYIGTDLLRKQMNKLLPDIDDNFWVKCLHEKIKRMVKENPKIRIAITDVRFPNEVEALKHLNIPYISLRVTRPSINNECKDVHESEMMIEKLDIQYDIINDGTLQDLYNKIENVLHN